MTGLRVLTPWLAVAGIILLLVLSAGRAGIDPASLWRNAENIRTLAADFIPPDFTDWRLFLEKTIDTLAVAVWGTVIAFVIAVPLGLFGAGTLAHPFVRAPVRLFMDACRAINEIVFALLFVAAVGLGPFAGVLALVIHTAGVLGKLFSESVEAADPKPMEGVRATGASALQEIVYGLIPQVWPLWLSYAFYRFESNVRAATVLGIVGAGGIGQMLYESIRGFDYGRAGAILIVIIVAVTVIDRLSGVLRKKLV